MCSIRTSSANNMNKLTLSSDDSVYLTENSGMLPAADAVLFVVCTVVYVILLLCI